MLALVSGHSIPMYIQSDEMILELLLIRLPGPGHVNLFRWVLDLILPGLCKATFLELSIVKNNLSCRLPGIEFRSAGILEPRCVIGTPPS